MEKPSIEVAKKNLFDVKKILDELGIVFMLDGGTLLGAVRDHNFCEDDQDDIDLTTLHDPKIIHELIERVSEIGFSVAHAWLEEDKKSAQIAIRRDGSKIDLMFKREIGEIVFWTVYKKDSVVYKVLPQKFYNNLLKYPFLGEWFLIPLDVEEYLTLRYGDYKTPVHRSKYSCYISDKCIIEPNTFENVLRLSK